MIRSFPTLLLKDLNSFVSSSKLTSSFPRRLKKSHFHSSCTRYFNTGNVDQLVWPKETVVRLTTRERDQSLKQPIEESNKFSDPNVSKLFIVHGIEGHVRILNFLGDLLKGPAFAFQLSANAAGFPVKELASEYVKEMKKVQPKGPYIIGGYSSGAAVAFEMVTQLEQQHQEKVSDYILLDGHICFLKNDFNVLSFVQEILAGYFEEVESQVGLLDALAKGKNNQELYEIILRFLKSQVPPQSYKKFKVFFDLLMTYFYSLESYSPAYEYHGNSLLIKAKDGSTDYGMTDPEPKMRKYCKGPVTVHTVQGDHHTFLLPILVRETADSLNEYFYPEIPIPESQKTRND